MEGRLSARLYSPNLKIILNLDSLCQREWLQEMPGQSRTDVMSLMIGKLKSISFTEPQQKSEEIMASRLKTFAQLSAALS